MSSRITILLCGCVCWLALTGCHAPGKPGGPTMAGVRAENFEALWGRCVRTLRKHHFAPDRQDRRLGILTSHPSVSMQFFEPWRDDAPGAYQFFEANLSTIRRIVEIRVEVADRPSDEYQVSVQVDKYRYSAPERQVTTASGALQIFGEKLPTTTGERLSREEGVHWAKLGRDGRLELDLLGEIIEHFPPGYSPPSGGPD